MNRFLSCAALAALMALPIASQAQEGQTMTGQVMSVRPADQEFVVRSDTNREQRTLQVTPDTKITIAGKPTRLRDIQRGDNVVLRFAPNAAGEPIVVAVQVPQPAEPVEQRLAQAPVVQQPLPAALPKTASPLAGIALAGLLLLLGVAVSRVSRANRG